jgi:hypothetical protein
MTIPKQKGLILLAVLLFILPFILCYYLFILCFISIIKNLILLKNDKVLGMSKLGSNILRKRQQTDEKSKNICQLLTRRWPDRNRAVKSPATGVRAGIDGSLS